jgi:hypothetical protein
VIGILAEFPSRGCMCQENMQAVSSISDIPEIIYITDTITLLTPYVVNEVWRR